MKLPLPARKSTLILSIVLLLVFIGAYKLIGFLFGVGVSFPPNACDLKTGQELRGDLMFSSRDLCLQKLAEDTLNPQICKNISWGSSSCLRSLAIKTRKPNLCLEVPKSSSRDHMYDRDYCLEGYVKVIPDESACLLIEDRGIKGDCYFDVMSNKAKTESNIEYCFNNLTDLRAYDCIKENAHSRAVCETSMRRLFKGKDWHEYLGKSLDYAIDECSTNK